MNIVLAKTAGFCFGVKRAVDLVYEEIKKGTKVYTYGPIIHNDEVVADLTLKGVGLINTLEELKSITEGTIIIRSHGVSKEIYDIIEKQGLKIVDATCPFVIKIHKIVKEQGELGRHIIIIGNNNHPEVEGIIGWCSNNYTVIENAEQAENLNLTGVDKICIVSQTTFNYKNFQDLVEIISKKGYDIIVLNTICNATEERQTEARQLAKESDAMIIIGGKHSSNTRKLYEISKLECENTYYIQTLRDLDLEELKSFRSVGITAGASTPNNIIKEVHTACQK
ncbi:4-hydroxy-3-methylbut-2-enyl diphosphate reductase [Anaerocolumna sp. MB42-C2]|uniref:4-hydroxy-3-methylbut-2-enyl diphosphate reductase n=1 Tax=Anaerocolumna sp. MB42-C2 TaxID=3070997 RepID=UPI0027DF0586|nr:4-hydroxy-3-methylbut-2-enyl diphosphate reductase [Anaerocolumna sp. MB42-C2]WMJ88314.1 4-hydroxy-3-methylbut-2-enyl diphosphate reductase [Anaerocolumna sp. MB42-C2]